jgi:aquaporin Z
MMNNKALMKYLMEYLGTLLFVFVILKMPNPLVIGLTLALLIFVASTTSGGHFNPAVSMAMWVRKSLRTNDALMYMVMQLLGGYSAYKLSKMI